MLYRLQFCKAGSVAFPCPCGSSQGLFVPSCTPGCAPLPRNCRPKITLRTHGHHLARKPRARESNEPSPSSGVISAQAREIPAPTPKLPGAAAAVPERDSPGDGEPTASRGQSSPWLIRLITSSVHVCILLSLLLSLFWAASGQEPRLCRPRGSQGLQPPACAGTWRPRCASALPRARCCPHQEVSRASQFARATLETPERAVLGISHDPAPSQLCCSPKKVPLPAPPCPWTGQECTAFISTAPKLPGCILHHFTRSHTATWPHNQALLSAGDF